MTNVHTAKTWILVGPPAAGKSSAGRELARRLRVDFIDVDEYIVKQTGRAITEIFATDGEATFRELEQDATTALIAKPGVISLGGGAVTSPRLRELLTGAPVIYLKMSVDEGVRRVGESTARPLLHGDVRGRLEALLTEREPHYEAVARFSIDTDSKTTHEVVNEILEMMEKQA